jgi:hypothetical protein
METKFYITEYPIGPYLDKQFTPWELEKVACEKCHLSLNGIIGYVCTNNDCPTGLGPVICSSI